MIFLALGSPSLHVKSSLLSSSICLFEFCFPPFLRDSHHDVTPCHSRNVFLKTYPSKTNCIQYFPKQPSDTKTISATWSYFIFEAAFLLQLMKLSSSFVYYCSMILCSARLFIDRSDQRSGKDVEPERLVYLFEF